MAYWRFLNVQRLHVQRLQRKRLRKFGVSVTFGEAPAPVYPDNITAATLLLSCFARYDLNHM